MESIKDFWAVYEFDPSQSLDQKGFGSVYKGKDKQTGETVVIKSTEMHPEFDQERILNKYKQAKELEHPNLLAYTKAHRFESKEVVANFGIMPYVERLSLDLLDPNDLTDEERLTWINQTIEGLAYLHEQGEVWQNLAASHILLAKEEDDYILKFINYGNKEVISTIFFTNYEYLAPEQFEEQTVLDKRTDIWSLGVLVYWLYTGQLPFGKKTTRHPNAKIQERILNRPIPDLIDLIPQPYRKIVKKCLEKDKEKRWANCGQIIEAIQDGFSATENVAQTKTQQSSSLELVDRRFLRKPSKPIVWWQVLVLFGLAALLGYWMSQSF